MRLAFRELRQFTERFFSIAGEEDLVRLQRELEENPEKGDVIPGAGGARKVRMGLRGRGKSGGARIIYYLHVSRDVVWLLDVYPKSEKADLSPAERRALSQVVALLKEEA